jgi:hypothetical protein
MINPPIEKTSEIEVMQPENKITVDSFVCDDFLLPVLNTDSPVTKDFLPPIARFLRQQLGHAALAEGEQTCFKNRRWHMYEED